MQNALIIKAIIPQCKRAHQATGTQACKQTAGHRKRTKSAQTHKRVETQYKYTATQPQKQASNQPHRIKSFKHKDTQSPKIQSKQTTHIQARRRKLALISNQEHRRAGWQAHGHPSIQAYVHTAAWAHRHRYTMLTRKHTRVYKIHKHKSTKPGLTIAAALKPTVTCKKTRQS